MPIDRSISNIHIALDNDDWHEFLQEDGYYHIPTRDLIAKGFLCDPSVNYTFDHPVALMGDIPENIKIISKDQGIIIKDKRGAIHLTEPPYEVSDTVEFGGQEYVAKPVKRNFDFAARHIKILGEDNKPAIIGTGAVIDCNGKIELQNVHMMTAAEVITGNHSLKVDSCRLDEGSKIVGEGVDISNSYVGGEVWGPNGPISIVDSQINGEVKFGKSPHVVNSHIAGKISAHMSPISLTRCHVQGEVEGARSYVNLLEGCTRSPSARIHGWTDGGYGGGRVEGTAQVVDSDELNAPASPEQFLRRRAMETLNGLSKGGATWMAAELEGTPVYTTTARVQNPQGVIHNINEILDMRLTLPARGPGKATIPASTLTLGGCKKLAAHPVKNMEQFLASTELDLKP